jgi:hypothetical protein
VGFRRSIVLLPPAGLNWSWIETPRIFVNFAEPFDRFTL